MKVHIIHENEEWTRPLAAALEQLQVPFVDWHVEQASIDLGTAPPQGIFYNRMSASSHARGHRFAPEYTATILHWLEAHQRRVINNSNALALEISKSLQYARLQQAGITTPRSICCSSPKQIIAAAKHFKEPFIIKHNRAGRGLGVKLFNNQAELEKHVHSSSFENSVDGVTILQEYIEANPKVIHRLEFINSQFFYAVQVDASDSFELCPADACNIEEQFCPTNPDGNKFMIIQKYQNANIEKYKKFLKDNHIEIAGIEYITAKDGTHYTYDVNTNTNYNSVAEQKAGLFGMKQIALFLQQELHAVYGSHR
jgi:hypothetical protein